MNLTTARYFHGIKCRILEQSSTVLCCSDKPNNGSVRADKNLGIISYRPLTEHVFEHQSSNELNRMICLEWTEHVSSYLSQGFLIHFFPSNYPLIPTPSDKFLKKLGSLKGFKCRRLTLAFPRKEAKRPERDWGKFPPPINLNSDIKPSLIPFFPIPSFFTLSTSLVILREHRKIVIPAFKIAPPPSLTFKFTSFSTTFLRRFLSQVFLVASIEWLGANLGLRRAN